MKKLFIAFLSIIMISPSIAQNDAIDSLRNVLPNTGGTEKVKTLYYLAHKLTEYNPKLASERIDQAIALAKKLGADLHLSYAYLIKSNLLRTQNKLDSAIAYNEKAGQYKTLLKAEPGKLFYLLDNSAVLHDLSGNHDSAFHYHKKAIALSKKKGLDKRLGSSYSNIASLYTKTGATSKALDYYHRALDIFKKLNDEQIIAIIHNNIGELNRKLGNHQKALEYYKSAININRKLNNRFRLTRTLGNTALIFSKIEQTDSALAYFNEALSLAKDIGNVKFIAQNHSNLGDLYAKLGNYERAIFHTKKSLKISRENNIQYGIMINSIHLAELYEHAGHYPKMLPLLKEALQIAEKQSRLHELISIYNGLYKYYKKSNRPARALHYHELKSTFKDSLLNIEKNRQITEMQTKYETEQKEKANQLLKKANQYQKARIEKQRYLFLLIAVVLLGLIVTGIILFRAKKRQHQYNRHLSAKNEEIKTQAEVLEKNNHKLQELSHFNQAMTRMMVHDLKSPLNIIINFTQNLENTRAKKLITQYSKQMLNLIMNILDVYRYDSSEIKLNKEHVSLRNIAGQAIDEVSYYADERNVHLTNSTSEQHFVVADRLLLSRVLVNLLSNAIKYSREGKQVSISSETNHANIAIQVKDEGIGISPEQLRSIFTNYKETQETQSPDKLSTGVGLHFCKIAIEAHKSQLRINSEKNAGTLIHFSLEKGERHGKHDSYPATIVAEPSASKLNPETYKQIEKPIEKLKTLKIYQISAIRQVLQEVDSEASNNPELRQWMEQIRQAASNGDRDRFYSLLQPAY